MENVIKYRGKIVFDPIDKTAKHEKQASWKKVAMILLDGEICEYYSWFLEKRYELHLLKPIRNAHVTFINDSISDIKKGNPNVDIEVLWNNLKQKYNNSEIEVVLDLDPRSDGTHWWFNINQNERELIHSIRAEIGLGRPFFSLHMSIGHANERNIEHSNYIKDLRTKFGNEYL